MNTFEFKELLKYNEPCFGYNNKEYIVSSPDGKYYVWAEDSPQDVNLVFDTVDDLLRGWFIQGKPLYQILPDIDLN